MVYGKQIKLESKNSGGFKMNNNLMVVDERVVLGKEFRIYGTFENPKFMAKDVAEWIEYSSYDGKYNVHKMLMTVDEDEKTVVQMILLDNDGIERTRNMTFLTEDGLYEVLMQSRKPIAKEFKKEVKKILKTIRKTGGYISNADLMVNTYFGALGEEHKGLIKGLFTNIEEQQKQLQLKDKEIEYSKNIITGLVDDVSLADKRQILNRVVRKSNANCKDRWISLYKEFDEAYHVKVSTRLKNHNEKNEIKVKSKLDYIDKIMGKLPELYEIACKLFETDVDDLIKEMYELQ